MSHPSLVQIQGQRNEKKITVHRTTNKANGKVKKEGN